jgi:hypothetical protein
MNFIFLTGLPTFLTRIWGFRFTGAGLGALGGATGAAGGATRFGSPTWGVDAKSATSEGAIDPAIWADGLPGVAVAWPFWTAWARFIAMAWFLLTAGMVSLLGKIIS